MPATVGEQVPLVLEWPPMMQQDMDIRIALWDSSGDFHSIWQRSHGSLSLVMLSLPSEGSVDVDDVGPRVG